MRSHGNKSANNPGQITGAGRPGYGQWPNGKQRYNTTLRDGTGRCFGSDRCSVSNGRNGANSNALASVYPRGLNEQLSGVENELASLQSRRSQSPLRHRWLNGRQRRARDLFSTWHRRLSTPHRLHRHQHHQHHHHCLLMFIYPTEQHAHLYKTVLFVFLNSS